jgi:two-component system, OmpR family, sensor kinase
MMRRFDTIATRTMALLLLGLGLFHLLSVWAYQVSLTREVETNNEMRVAERLLAIRRSIAAQPPQKREDLAHEMSGGSIDAHYGLRALAIPRSGDTSAASLRSRLIKEEPDLEKAGVVIGSEATGREATHKYSHDTHQMAVSLGLGDGTFVNVSLVKARHIPDAGHAAVWSTTLMAIGVILASLILVRWITKPLRALGAAARAIELAPQSERINIAPLPETGPREVVETARAFNEMQQRIATLVEDRTLSLAAISHDLKTPLTRLRLQVEDATSVEAKQRMIADIAEMETMIDSTLTFLRGVRADEPPRLFDVSAILDTIGTDLADQGHNVAVTGARHAIAVGHPLQIKRALTNLIQNAVRHGGRARVSLAFREDCIEIIISDDGPGIPTDQLDLARRPFQGLDPARSKSTGGFGLGLAIAERLITAQHGTLTLANRQPHGLDATVHLAKRPPSIAT